MAGEDGVDVVKEEVVVNYYCGNPACLTPLPSGAGKCHVCQSGNIKKHITGDLGPETNVSEIIDNMFVRPSDHRLR